VFGLLLALLILDGLLLSVIVLLQSGKGGGLAAMGGSGGTAADSLIGGRQAVTLLTKATWTTGGLFLFLALTLSVLSSRARTPDSILRDEFQSAPATPQPLPLPGTEPGGTVEPGAAGSGSEAAPGTTEQRDPTQPPR
jgi:preprotein translocase subunit SecG